MKFRVTHNDGLIEIVSNWDFLKRHDDIKRVDVILKTHFIQVNGPIKAFCKVGYASAFNNDPEFGCDVETANGVTITVRRKHA